MKTSKLSWLYIIFVYLFLYMPLFILIIFSFNDAASGTIWKGFTLRWYEKLFNSSALISGLINSLIVGVSAATLVTVIGTLSAVTLFRFNFFGKNFIMSLLYILIMSPEIIMGISLLLLFKFLSMDLGFQTLLITHITLCLPFVVAVLFTRLANFDVHIIEAAKDLGANELQTFFHIILPSILPAVVAAWILSFTISMDDSICAFFTSGPRFEILPQKIYAMVRTGVKPEVNALSTIIFGASMLIVIIAQIMLKERKK
ncbi:MAG: spermidine/putrescine ABC transporter permease PotC [Mucispirillum sp.]|uniref:Spermidine/putrescine ABC transporter permease PotC n=1 Tax=Candidatus Mucispirillum faecigallinarum TaxID=2838699 RepID=A0A9D2GSI6_9BACT|nr:spermidine/putrescine ABC transporter permease PotC [Mucispirillum sp.]HIZ88374.1 spermidine/putrescine ABC transporter permease PotC [Candidatus Mucispirillum faecigallinarum]